MRFCVTVTAYEQFLRETQLQRVIQMELGRKPFWNRFVWCGRPWARMRVWCTARKLALNPFWSRMAVLIQEMRIEDRSGVAFGRQVFSEEEPNTRRRSRFMHACQKLSIQRGLSRFSIWISSPSFSITSPRVRTLHSRARAPITTGILVMFSRIKSRASF